MDCILLYCSSHGEMRPFGWRWIVIVWIFVWRTSRCWPNSLRAGDGHVHLCKGRIGAVMNNRKSLTPSPLPGATGGSNSPGGGGGPAGSSSQSAVALQGPGALGSFRWQKLSPVSAFELFFEFEASRLLVLSVSSLRIPTIGFLRNFILQNGFPLLGYPHTLINAA